MVGPWEGENRICWTEGLCMLGPQVHRWHYLAGGSGPGAQLPTGGGGGGTGTVYLVPFVAPPSAHPVGPHSREEGQVIAIGLRQEHRLPRMQGEAGAGVPLLRDSGATQAGGGYRLGLPPPPGALPRTLPVGLVLAPGPWLQGLYCSYGCWTSGVSQGSPWTKLKESAGLAPSGGTREDVFPVLHSF